MRAWMAGVVALAGCPKTVETASPVDTGATGIVDTEDTEDTEDTVDSDTIDTQDTGDERATVLWVSAYSTGQVVRFDTATGEVLGVLAEAPGAQSVHVGPDGAVYVVAEEADQVLRVADGVQTVFVGDDPKTADDELGGLDAPTSAVWGPDGLLYVGGYASDNVVRYDATGAFVDVFAAELDGLDGPDAGMRFGPDGYLYIPCFDGDQVLVLDAAGAVVTRLTDGVDSPRALHFTDDGELWITSWRGGRVLRYVDGVRGDDVLYTGAPTGLAVDVDGVWVGTDQADTITLIAPGTSEVLRTLEGAKLGLDGITWLEWEPAGLR